MISTKKEEVGGGGDAEVVEVVEVVKVVEVYLISKLKEEVGGGGVVAAPFLHVIVAFRQFVADRAPEPSLQPYLTSFS